jgi:trehalose-phosphatase
MKLQIEGIEAAIFDMDGVITQTARQHEKAWKQLFDVYLSTRKDEFTPFNHNDYLSYVDGKLRYDGVASFLKSRGTVLPHGDPSDSPEKETICGLGNRKNAQFLRIIESEGADVYPDTIAQIKKWKANGLKIGVISASKNARLILEKAGVLHLFDTRVDGQVSAELGLRGKPEPDIFVEAANRLKAPPNKTIVFEDAEAGVKAGQAGGFQFVLGVKRSGPKSGLLANGAHWVITNFDEINITDQTEEEPSFHEELPSAMGEKATIFKQFQEKKPALFFDYDGTLTPIVSQPEDAVLGENMRQAIIKLAEKYPVAVVSGRDLRDIQQLVGLDKLIYAGSHGYHIEGPNSLYLENEEAQAVLPLLDQLEQQLQQELADEIPGCKIDRKKFAIAVHYRNVGESLVEAVKSEVQHVVDEHENLKLGTGKRILEIKPAIDWHKGKAVYWLLDKLNLTVDNTIPVYFGDDVTDEDAFRAIIDDGISILVGQHDQPTAAHYRLKDVDELEQFLTQLIQQP